MNLHGERTSLQSLRFKGFYSISKGVAMVVWARVKGTYLSGFSELYSCAPVAVFAQAFVGKDLARWQQFGDVRRRRSNDGSLQLRVPL